MNKARLFNLPNALTFARIFAIPLVALCFFFPSNTARWIALAVFILAAATDYLDGYFARIYQLQSRFGQMLDPIADKLLIAVCLLLLVGDGTIGGAMIWAAIVILCREILVSGLREFLADLRVSIPVTNLAKWKTVLQSVAIGFLLAGPAGEAVLPFTLEIGAIALWCAAILTLYTGYDYFRAGLEHLV